MALPVLIITNLIVVLIDILWFIKVRKDDYSGDTFAGWAVASFLFVIFIMVFNFNVLKRFN